MHAGWAGPLPTCLVPVALLGDRGGEGPAAADGRGNWAGEPPTRGRATSGRKGDRPGLHQDAACDHKPGPPSLSSCCLLQDRAKCIGDPVLEPLLRLVIITFFSFFFFFPPFHFKRATYQCAVAGLEGDGSQEACPRPAVTDCSSVVWGLVLAASSASFL